MPEYSKTKTSYYRRLYVAHLINSEVNSVPAIIAQTGMPRRTVQDTILALHELDIDCEFVGGNKNGGYRINDWGAINSGWIRLNRAKLKQVLGFA